MFEPPIASDLDKRSEIARFAANVRDKACVEPPAPIHPATGKLPPERPYDRIPASRKYDYVRDPSQPETAAQKAGVAPLTDEELSSGFHTHTDGSMSPKSPRWQGQIGIVAPPEQVDLNTYLNGPAIAKAQWAANSHGGNARHYRVNPHISGQRDVTGEVIGQFGAQEPVGQVIPRAEAPSAWQREIAAKGGRVLNQELRDKQSNKVGSMRMHGAACFVMDERNAWEQPPGRVPNQKGYF